MTPADHGPDPLTLTRRTLVGGSLAVATAALLPWRAATAAPALPGSVPPFPPDWGPIASQYLQEWAENRADHPYLADFTAAGYRGGSVGLPARSTHRGRRVDVRRFGALGDGETDDHPAFLAAIDSLGAAGGMVIVPAGRYLLAKPLFITRDNVFVAGAGSDRTTLYFPNTLHDSFRSGFQGEDGSSIYSWFGGQVWFSTQRVLDRFPDRGQEHWVPGSTLLPVAAAPRGATSLTVASGHGVARGDTVLLEMDVTADASLLKAMCGDVGGADAYNWAAAESLLPGARQFPDRSKYQWPVRVKAVAGDTLELEEALHLPVREGWNARVSVLESVIRNVGLEGVTIENKVITQTRHNRNPGSNGVCFSHVIDGWARDVTVLNADCAFNFTAAKHCTLHGTRVGGRACHHPYACRVQSHDNVVEYFTTETPSIPTVEGADYHGINVEGYSSGNVWRQGQMHHGVFDSHRAVPFDILRTAITMQVAGGIGGAGHAGPNYGGRATHWGVEVTGPNGLGVLADDGAPRALMIGIRGTTAPSRLASPIPAPRESRRHLFRGAMVPYDVYMAQRIVAGLSPEPTPPR